MLQNFHPGRVRRLFGSESVVCFAKEFLGSCSSVRQVRLASTSFPFTSKPFVLCQCSHPMAENAALVPERPVRFLSNAVIESGVYDVGKATNIKWHESKVAKEDREKLMNQKGCVLWFTGLSGSGKSTLAYTLDHALTNLGKMSYVLDGDNVRHGLNKNLGFSHSDREENIRRVGEVAKLFTEANLITLVSFISPYREDRRSARDLFPKGDFIEVFMKIPLAVCEARDPKGLYKMARDGKIKGFTGIDDPYEEPEDPEIVMEVSNEEGNLIAPEVMADYVIQYLEEKGFLTGQ